MKTIAVTMRVDKISSYKETRDSLDQRWSEFFNKIGFIPFLIPNSLKTVKIILNTYKFDGFLLTGGNSLVKYGGDAPERDETEKFMLDYALVHDIPLIGVCRGMQFIQDYFGILLSGVSNHIKSEQTILFNGKEHLVNSYHTLGAFNSIDELKITGHSSDGVIKAIRHVEKRILGIMWHPERIYPFRIDDINLFKEFYNK